MDEVSFDELAKQAFAPGAGEPDFERLFAAAFSLSAWNFIAVGEMPNPLPYCALFPDFFGDKPAVAVFTDTERAHRYMAESNEKFGSAGAPVIVNSGDIRVRFSSENLVMSIPTSSVLDYLDGLISKGIIKIFFNPDKNSHGFSQELSLMRPVWNHLVGKGLLSQPAGAKAEVPSAPTENGSDQAAEADFDALSRKTNETNVAREHFDKLFEATFALPEWQFIARGEAPNFAPYVASNAAIADGQQMIRAFTDGKRLHRFAQENGLTEPDGTALTLTIPISGIVEYLEQFEQYGVYGVWFNSDSESDGYFVPLKQLRPIKEHLERLKNPTPEDEARGRQDNLANYGMSQTEDGGVDLNLVMNHVGVVNWNTTILPFYEAIVPLLIDFQGTGEFVTLLAFDPAGVSQKTGNIGENEHGPYLRTLKFHYLNPKNGVHIEVSSVHTNRLRHVRTGAELTVSIELCKNIDNDTAVLYHRFEGPRAEVLNLSNEFEPILSRSDYDPVK